MISYMTTQAYTDSEKGKVGVYLGAVMTYVPTTFACKVGDTLQLQVNNGHPLVIGVVGRGDETQAQLDDATSEVDNLTGNIVATDKELKLYANKQEFNIDGAYIDLSGDRAKVNQPSEDEEDNEIATCKWVKDLVTKTIKAKNLQQRRRK